MGNRVGTYRVQLSPAFGFFAAEQVVAYLADLGVSHFYASPYLQAVAGSSHGYDVVDPGQINEELGGEAGWGQLCAALSEAGLMQLVDVVPNHMAIQGGHNRWWWDVLENGPSSPYSPFFDVEWQASTSERVMLPILGDQYGVELEAGKITLTREGAHFFVCYYEHRNPVAPRALGHLLRPVAAAMGSSELGFAADTLAELPAPNAPDVASQRRRHRDKQVLLEQLTRLCAEPDVQRAIDQHLAQVNASPDALHDVLERQIYRLAFWKVGNHELEYRRFFDIDSLVGLRVEDDEVLAATHQLIFKWLEEGSVDGLRIDHIDGLYDPRQYLARVGSHAPKAWLLVEKILGEDETLPDWPVAGTTGYEFLNQALRVLIDPQGRAEIDGTYRDIIGMEEDYATVLDQCKRHVLRESLASDVQRLAVRLGLICQQHRRHRDHSRVELKRALIELCVAFPVYRTYARPDTEVGPNDRRVIVEACARARDAAPAIDPRLFDFIERVLLLEWRNPDELEFVMRFQQLTGPVMAKGAEDTAFYRFARFVALNEVGGNPGQFSLDAAEFHELMRQRQKSSPQALSTTSTHDTKRSEDVRARLLTLSEAPQRWQQAVAEWRTLLGTSNQGEQTRDETAMDPGTEYLLLQNVVGAWPISKQRMLEYATKAVREAKLRSSWHAPNEAYERSVADYLERLFADQQVLAGIEAFVASIAEGAVANALNQLVLKMLCPGVPDLFQGTELWDFSLVDPDNRRPVDYALRVRFAEEARLTTPKQLWADRSNGAIKLHFIRECLHLRRRRAGSFDAEGVYTPLSARGADADRLIAFQRGQDAMAIATRWWVKRAGLFADTCLVLPPGQWKNILTGTRGWSGEVLVGALIEPFPAAVLERE